MRVQSLRKHYPTFWRQISRFTVLILAAEALWLCSMMTAHGATSVSYLSAAPAEGFQATRVYAGRTAPGRASELGFKFGGEIDALHVDIGDQVNEGDPIARLDTRSQEARLAEAAADVNLAAANLLALEAETQLARQTEARFRSLRDRGHAADQVYDEQRLALRAKQAQLAVATANLQRAKARKHTAAVALEEAEIRAPFAGVVQARYVDEGAQTRAGTPIVRLVETSHKEAHVGIPEDKVASLEPGQTYTLRWNGQQITAVLKALLPEVDEASRTVTTVLDLRESVVPLGAVVELELSHFVESPGYWLPLTALTESDRGLWGVFVVDADDTVERRLVEIVHIESERAYVRGTLAAGDQIVRTGVQRLVPGQRVGLATGD